MLYVIYSPHYELPCSNSLYSFGVYKTKNEFISHLISYVQENIESITNMDGDDARYELITQMGELTKLSQSATVEEAELSKLCIEAGCFSLSIKFAESYPEALKKFKKMMPELFDEEYEDFLELLENEEDFESEYDEDDIMRLFAKLYKLRSNTSEAEFAELFDSLGYALSEESVF